MSNFTKTSANKLHQLLLMMIVTAGLFAFARFADSADFSSPPTRIELIDASSVLSNYTNATTPKERLPFVHLGNVRKKDFFTCYGSANRIFHPTRIAYIKQINPNTFTVTRIHPKQNKLSRAEYKLIYQGDKLLIDWGTSLRDKFDKRMGQIARDKKQYREQLIHSVLNDIATLLGIGVALVVFLLPTIIGLRKHPVKTIYAINFLLLTFPLLPSLGLSLAIITWAGCLIWAIVNPPCLKRKTIIELQQ